MSSHLEDDTIDDILYFARTADIPDLLIQLNALTATLDIPALAIVSEAKDATTGNTALHYAAANGHSDVVLAILATADATHLNNDQDSKKSLRVTVPSLATQPNNAGNLPLHYAALNGHLDTSKILLLALMPSFSAISFQKSDSGYLSPAADLDDAIRTALGSLDDERKGSLLRILEIKNGAGRDAAGEAESAAKDEIVGWLLGVMDRLDGGAGDDGDDEDSSKMSMGDMSAGDIAEDVGDIKVKD